MNHGEKSTMSLQSLSGQRESQKSSLDGVKDLLKIHLRLDLILSGPQSLR